MAWNSPYTHCLLPRCLTAFGPQLKGGCAVAKLAQRCWEAPAMSEEWGEAGGLWLKSILCPLDVICPTGSARIRADAGASWQL